LLWCLKVILHKGGDKMIKRIEGITIFSQNASKLAKFYREKVGLKVTFEAAMGENDEELYMFEMPKGGILYIVDHSKVKGKNKTPERTIINFEVGNIKEDVKRLGKMGVKKIQDIYHVEEYGYIATFEDIDGNYFQLVQTKAN